MMKISTVVIILIMLLFSISKLLKTSLSSSEKKNIFECGFDPSHEKRNGFSLRFFLLTIIFLLFDLEITFIMPLPLQMKSSSVLTNTSMHMFILFFFVASTYLEWKQGALSWMW